MKFPALLSPGEFGVFWFSFALSCFSGVSSFCSTMGTCLLVLKKTLVAERRLPHGRELHLKCLGRVFISFAHILQCVGNCATKSGIKLFFYLL